MADKIGVRSLLVHAIDDQAAEFYRRYGFIQSPLDEQTLFLTMKAIRASIKRAGSSKPMRST